MSDIHADLWTGSSHKETGKAFQVAIAEALKFRPELDRSDPLDSAFLAGLGYLLNLADHQLAYLRLPGFKRDLGSVTAAARAELAGYRTQFKEAAMPVVQEQVDQKLDQLGIETPPPKRRAVRKSKDHKELWPWYLEYRRSNPNARITCEPDADGYHRVYARRA